MEELNIRQQRFLEHYLKTGNGAESIRVAGYKSKNPSRYALELLENPIIRNKTQQLKQNTTVNIDSLIYEIENIAFNPTSDKISNNEKIRCLELLAKIKGLISSGHKTDIQQNVNLQNEQLNAVLTFSFLKYAYPSVQKIYPKLKAEGLSDEAISRILDISVQKLTQILAKPENTGK